MGRSQYPFVRLFLFSSDSDPQPMGHKVNVSPKNTCFNRASFRFSEIQKNVVFKMIFLSKHTNPKAYRKAQLHPHFLFV